MTNHESKRSDYGAPTYPALTHHLPQGRRLRGRSPRPVPGDSQTTAEGMEADRYANEEGELLDRRFCDKPLILE